MKMFVTMLVLGSLFGCVQTPTTQPQPSAVALQSNAEIVVSESFRFEKFVPVPDAQYERLANDDPLVVRVNAEIMRQIALQRPGFTDGMSFFFQGAELEKQSHRIYFEYNTRGFDQPTLNYIFDIATNTIISGYVARTNW